MADTNQEPANIVGGGASHLQPNILPLKNLDRKCCSWATAAASHIKLIFGYSNSLEYWLNTTIPINTVCAIFISFSQEQGESKAPFTLTVVPWEISKKTADVADLAALHYLLFCFPLNFMGRYRGKPLKVHFSNSTFLCAWQKILAAEIYFKCMTRDHTCANRAIENKAICLLYWWTAFSVLVQRRSPASGVNRA